MKIVSKRKPSIYTSSLRKGNVISLVGYARYEENDIKTDNPIYANDYKIVLRDAWLVLNSNSDGEVKLMNLETMETIDIRWIEDVTRNFTERLTAVIKSRTFYDKNYSKTTLFVHDKIASIELSGATREESQHAHAWNSWYR